MTGLSELARRDRRATVGSWLGHSFWGSGANFEAKAMISALAFQRLGFDRLTAWANTRNGRSQRALERIGFRREGVLTAWHRHGDRVHDVVIFGLLRAAWEHGPAVRGAGDDRGHAAAGVHRGLTRAGSPLGVGPSERSRRSRARSSISRAELSPARVLRDGER